MSVYDFQAETLDGKPAPLADWRGQVLLIVNTASKCGFTPQYAGLEKLYRTYKERGFSVLGFPCNQFGAQEPGDADEIASFCSLTYDVSFPMMAKIDVNGPSAHPLYAYLKHAKKGMLGSAGDQVELHQVPRRPSGRAGPPLRPARQAGGAVVGHRGRCSDGRCVRRGGDRRRARRLCGGDPRQPARARHRHRRAREPRRHLPELGLHPDQGAAEDRRDLRHAGPPRRLRPLGEGARATTSAR